ncbi:hypothetical protein LXL04_000964 [Taraxacum kok-saghyz]
MINHLRQPPLPPATVALVAAGIGVLIRPLNPVNRYCMGRSFHDSLALVVCFWLFSGFSGEVKPPPATLSMVEGGGFQNIQIFSIWSSGLGVMIVSVRLRKSRKIHCLCAFLRLMLLSIRVETELAKERTEDHGTTSSQPRRSDRGLGYCTLCGLHVYVLSVRVTSHYFASVALSVLDGTGTRPGESGRAGLYDLGGLDSGCVESGTFPQFCEMVSKMEVDVVAKNGCRRP